MRIGWFGIACCVAVLVVLYGLHCLEVDRAYVRGVTDEKALWKIGVYER